MLPPESDTIAYQDADGVPRPRTLINALGPAIANQETVIIAVARQIEATGRRPVICASELRLEFMVNGTLPIELLPRHVDLPILSAAEYAAYLTRRWETLLAKWQIDEEVTLGQTFETFLATHTTHCAAAR